MQVQFKNTKPVDFSAFDGVWIPCAGSVTPWGSHFGSEEYEPDARAFFESEAPAEMDTWLGSIIKDFMRYFPDASGSSPDDLVKSGFNPYFYGYAWETKVADGKPWTEKLCSQGRMSWELPYGTDPESDRFCRGSMLSCLSMHCRRACYPLERSTLILSFHSYA